MVISRLFFRSSPTTEAARRLYAAIQRQARSPEFHACLGVPDTLDGRFDLLALHMFLVLRRLKREGENARELAQCLFDVLFDDMDRSLREMGVADLGVGKRVKAMAQALYGRIAAYDAGLARASDEKLEDALRRNLYGTGGAEAAYLSSLAAYLRRQATGLDAQAFERLAAGIVEFGPLPETQWNTLGNST
jgi:cytochrome b pre-mRNA-processing protein 3